MSEFDEWTRDNFYAPYDVPTPEQAFEAGQQSQQAKIDELQARVRIYEKHVKAIKHIHETQFDENTDTSFILGNLDGFFECLEDDLKCEAKQT